MTPREQRIAKSKLQFVNTCPGSPDIKISNLLLSVENLFQEADAVFKQCKQDCDSIQGLVTSSLKAEEIKQKRTAPKTPMSARKIVQSMNFI